MIDVNSIKKGMTLIIDGNICQIVDFLHVKPGKGSAFMKAKYKNLRTGTTLEQNFNTNIKFEEARIDRQKVQFLYSSGDTYNFMNVETYDQIELSETQIGDNKDFLIENMEVDIAQYNGELLGITLPEKIVLTITRCDPAAKGNTQTNATKDAYVETGLLVKVPMFIEEGEKIIISTETGKYSSRA